MTRAAHCRPFSRLLTAAGLILGLLGDLSVSATRAADASASTIPGYVAVPLQRTGNYIVIRVEMNGRPVPLILDTGASTTVISQTAYDAVKTPGGESHLLSGAQGRKSSFNGKPARIRWVENMRANGMNFGGGPMQVTDLSVIRDHAMIVGKSRANIEGLLGEDVLMRYGAIIDPSRQVVYFNTDPAKKAHLGSLVTKSGWTAIPMQRTSGHHFAVPTEISGKSFRLIVDTGSPTTLVDRGVLEALKMESSQTFVAGGIVNEEVQRMRSVIVKKWGIGNYTIPSFPIAMQHLPADLLNERSANGSMMGLLGEDVLLINHAMIDIGTETLYLHPY